MGTSKAHDHGITLVELVIVMAFLGLLAAMVVPNFVKIRGQPSGMPCIINLQTIEGAKGIWALEMKKSTNDVPLDRDLFGPDKCITSKPRCPAGGTYKLGAVKDKPTCTVAGHTL